MYGPPYSGQNVSQLPHSLQKSAKHAICRSRSIANRRAGAVQLHDPSGSIRRSWYSKATLGVG